MKKSFLIIGLGDFGKYLCRDLAKMKNEIMIVDRNERALEDLLDVATSSLIADCTRESVLKKIGVGNFDVCFVCISHDFQSSLEVTSLLKEFGAQYVVSQAANDAHKKFLLRIGADEVIHPHQDSAKRAAVKYNSEHVFDYVDLKDGYSVYEITPLPEWVGRSILDSNVRARYDVYIVAVIHASGGTEFMPGSQTVIGSDDHLMVLTNEETMENLLRRL
ncbi:MAG: TrkA family potassium uptake protein [Lachnospiraceae bacterium]|nr:TrkA family potassium uptake protein [Lachnospiraceae bacterium]